MTVTPPSAEKPRVTIQFSYEAWAALDAPGQKVTGTSRSNDVPPPDPVGGEPTFRFVDELASAEWNIAALRLRPSRILAVRLTAVARA